MTHKDIAEILGITQAGYSHKEIGKREFSLSEAMEICKATQFDPAFLVTEMAIESADLQGKARGIRDVVIENLGTLNEKQLTAVNEFIKTL